MKIIDLRALTKQKTILHGRFHGNSGLVSLHHEHTCIEKSSSDYNTFKNLDFFWC
jgi:hypothetical protein